MGAAANRRGDRVIARDVDKSMPAALKRASKQAEKDEVARMKDHIARLERDLARARRCLAAERYARETRVSQLKDELRSSALGTTVLCRLAFPGDAT